MCVRFVHWVPGPARLTDKPPAFEAAFTRSNRVRDTKYARSGVIAARKVVIFEDWEHNPTIATIRTHGEWVSRLLVRER